MPEQRIRVQTALDGLERDHRRRRNQLHYNALWPLLGRVRTAPLSKGSSKGGSKGCFASGPELARAALLDACLIPQAPGRTDRNRNPRFHIELGHHGVLDGYLIRQMSPCPDECPTIAGDMDR